MSLRPTPNQVKLSVALAKEAILKFLPIREFWFSENAFEYKDAGSITKKGEVGKLVDAIADQVGELNAEIRNAKNNFYLETAEGPALDAWGSDITIARKLEESDENYRTRILNIIKKEKLTKPAIQSYLVNLTGISVEVFEPWKFLEIRDNRSLSLPVYKPNEGPSSGVHTPAKDVPDRINSRSGKAVRGSAYWQAGVLDISTEGYAPVIRNATFEVVALGVKTFFTVKLNNGEIGIAYPNPESFPDKVFLSLESTRFVKWFIGDLQKYSGTYPRSGNRETYGYTELYYTKLNSYDDLVVPDGKDKNQVTVDLDILRVSESVFVVDPDSEIWKWFDGNYSEHDPINVLPPEMDWIFLPDTVSYLTTLWDLPEYDFLSVWDTAFSWEELSTGSTWDKTLDAVRSDLSWDDAIIIGYFDVFKSEFTQLDLTDLVVSKDW